MKNLLLTLVLFMFCLSAAAQDEGQAVAKARFERDKSIYFSGGPSLTFGDNIGDYSNGINFEAGFVTRLNKIVSIGPSISYVKFKYDPEITSDIGGAYVEDLGDGYWQGYIINLTGGDLSLTSLAFNLKLNLIPISDNSKIAVYAFAKPFVSYSKRTDVFGVSDYYLSYNDGATWDLEESGIEWGPDDYDILKEKSEVTGGIFIGGGLEFFPNGKVSFFVQPSLGYTLPVTFISTQSYEPTVEAYLDDNFPMVTKGFPSLNIQFGISFNF
jgi:hypothetical protein